MDRGGVMKLDKQLGEVKLPEQKKIDEKPVVSGK